MIKFRVPTLAFQFWRFSKYLNQVFSVILKIALKWILTFGPPTNCINSFSLVLLFFKSISFHSCRYGGEPVPFKVVPCGMSLSTLHSNSYHSLLWGRLTGNQGTSAITEPSHRAEGSWALEMGLVRVLALLCWWRGAYGEQYALSGKQDTCFRHVALRTKRRNLQVPCKVPYSTNCTP